MAEFFSMGGYAPYVWSSFGLTFVVLATNAIIAFRSHEKTLRDIRRRQEEISR